jgi:hypothetical protein
MNGNQLAFHYLRGKICVKLHAVHIDQGKGVKKKSIRWMTVVSVSSQERLKTGLVISHICSK